MLSLETLLNRVSENNISFPSKTVPRVRVWFTDGNGNFVPLKALAESFGFSETRVFVSHVQAWVEPANDLYDDLWALFSMREGVAPAKNNVVTIYKIRSSEISLRSILEKVVVTLSGEERELLQRLLDQKSERYGTLLDECEYAIFG